MNCFKMRNFCKVLFIGALIVCASCNKDKKEIFDKGADLNATSSQSLVKFSDENVQLVYTSYLELKAGLVNSNEETVRNAAKKLEETLKDSKENKQLRATAKLVSLTKDLKKQRDFFVTITDEVGRIVSTADIESGEVYKQYCPMAFEGSGGYWLSDSEEIRNPYFGSQMLKCGSVKEAIK